MTHLPAIRARLMLALLLVLVLNGCDSPSDPITVASVTVTAPASALIVEETLQNAAVARDAAGNPLTDRVIEWSSSDPAIATVSATGLVAGVAPGSVTITARSEGRAGQVTLEILPIPVASVSVSPDTVTLEVGGTRRLVATPRDSGGNALIGRGVAWSSSNETIARVASDGTVTAVAQGTATIRATSEGRTGSSTVTVVPVPPPPITPPTGVRVERLSRLRALVTWGAVDRAESYRIERRLSGGGWGVAGTTTGVQFVDDAPRLRGATYEYRVTALGGGSSSPPSAAVSTVVPAVRLALIGDSNLGWGKSGNTTVAASYVQGHSLSVDTDSYPDHPKLFSGKIMALWADVEAVNHGISSTGTGRGTITNGHPNALHVINGITRFEAEILGRGYPWTAANIPRINAFTPTAVDFGYYSLGVNDIWAGTAPETIRDNISAAIDLWLAAGLPAAHLMVTTVGPRTTSSYRTNIPVLNGMIRTLAAAKGVSLVDIAALVSDDDGLTWKAPSLHIGDGLHYTESTLEMLAVEVVAVMRRQRP
jgi:hypothetical protein